MIDAKWGKPAREVVTSGSMRTKNIWGDDCSGLGSHGIMGISQWARLGRVKWLDRCKEGWPRTPQEGLSVRFEAGETYTGEMVRPWWARAAVVC